MCTESFGRSVAVIGSGVAGLTAAYALSGRDRVTLYEADTRLGGHAHTHGVDRGDGTFIGVDSAFLVHNDRTYPTLCRLFDELGVRTQESDMSMSVRSDATGLEYAGALGVRGLFASWQSARPRYLRMLAEIKRFHRAARRVLSDDDADDLETLDAFLRRHRFSRVLRRTLHHAVGGGGVVLQQQRCAALSGALPVRFSRPPRHAVGLRLTDVAHDRPGARRSTCDAIAERLHEVRLGQSVRGLRRLADGVQVQAGDGRRRDVRRRGGRRAPRPGAALLDDPSRHERAVLGAIPYSTNHAQLHTDESVLPRRQHARASWNYLIRPNRRPRAGHLRRQQADAHRRRPPIPGDARRP